MSIDPAPPTTSGLKGLTEWCRRDRSSPRLVLAAAAGDPVALEHLLSQLARPAAANVDSIAIEIAAARRPTRLIDLVESWPDANDPALSRAEALAWRTAFRHLETRERIDAEAAMRGPLVEEARLVIDGATPCMAPVSWASFSDRASFRTFPLDELRTIGRLGFVEPELDVTPLLGQSAVLLRVLRGRWQMATHLTEFVDHHDIWNAEPLDLAVWWEAAQATGRRELLADRIGEAIAQRLLVEEQPQRCWPAVLAAFTGWVVP